MEIISSASSSSCWRGLDYYKNKKIKNIKKISDIEYTSVASGTEDYSVYLNLKNPRKSTCNCPLANGKRIICKHIVVTYFNVVPDSAEELRMNKIDYKKNTKNIKKMNIKM